MLDVPDDDRVALLASRVRWLDRYRRLIAVVAALVVAPLVMRELAALLGAHWRDAHVVLLAVIPAVMSWWCVEVGLAWLAALWETEYHRRSRDRGLPRAELVRRSPGRR